MQPMNGFIQYLGQKYGSGLGAKADASGNHVLASQLTDAYAQAGQVVPTNLQPAIKELNDIVQQEYYLDRVSPATRASLAGTGYDPAGRRRRVAELEEYLLTQSADARNLAQRLANEQAQQQVIAMEQANRLDAMTLNSKAAATIAQNQLAIASAQQGVDDLAEGRLLKSTAKAAYNSGKSQDELYEIWGSNDPVLMQSVFGTTDRLVIQKALVGMTTAGNDVDTARMASMTSAVTRTAMQLAADASITDEQLMAMTAGQLAIPNGGSRISAGMALSERQKLISARTELQVARGQGIVAENELNKLLASSLSMGQKAALLAGALGAGMTTDKLLEAMNAGQADQLLASLQGKTIPVTDSTGITQQVQAGQLLASLMEDLDAAHAATAGKLMQSSAMMQFQQEAKENARALDMSLALLGQPLPPQYSTIVQGLVGQANELIVAAGREPDATKRDALLAAAKQNFASARQQIADFAKQSGTPDYIIKDIEQGRFSSDASYKRALVDLLGFGDASLRGHPLGVAITDLLKARGITSADLREWAANPDADLTDLKHSGLLMDGKAITQKDIAEIVQSVGQVAISNVMVEAIFNSPWTQFITPQAKEILEPLLDGSAKQRGLTADDLNRRIMYVARIIDEQASMASQRAQDQAARSGQPMDGPVYTPGAIFRTMQDAVNSNPDLIRMFSGNNSAIPIRPIAALLTEYNYFMTGQARSGPGAVSYDNIIPTAIANIQRGLSISMAGNALASIGNVKPIAYVSAQRWAAAMAGNPNAEAFGFADTPASEALYSVRDAVLQIMAERAAKAPASTIWSTFGLEDPAEGAAMRTYPTIDEINAQLIRMGLDPAQIAAQANQR